MATGGDWSSGWGQPPSTGSSFSYPSLNLNEENVRPVVGSNPHPPPVQQQPQALHRPVEQVVRPIQPASEMGSMQSSYYGSSVPGYQLQDLSYAGCTLSTSHLVADVGHMHTSAPHQPVLPKQTSNILPAAPDPRVPPSPEMAAILEKLHLRNYFPAKISLQDVMKVSLHNGNDSHDYKHLTWRLVKKLVMCYHQARDCEVGKCIDFSPSSTNDDGVDDDDLFGDDSAVEGLHPLDVLVVVFQCCNPILQQVLAQKMVQCQLACPFIFPFGENLLCYLWSLKTIVSEWRYENNAKEKSLTRNPIHNVSFMKIGQPSFSKSRLVNEVISLPSQNTFCNWDSPNGRNMRTISNGLIEVCQFLPSDADSRNGFRQELLVFNLRGNSIDHCHQSDILVKMSSALVLLVEAEQFNLLQENICNMVSAKTVVVLTTATHCPRGNLAVRAAYRTLRNIMKDKGFEQNLIPAFSDTRQKSASDIAQDVQRKVQIIVDNRQEDIFSIEHHCVNLALVDNRFLVDEQCILSCRQAIKAVAHICEDEKNFCAKKKDVILPLQCKMWEEYATVLRRMYRAATLREDRPLHEVQDELQTTLDNIRHVQKQSSENLSLAMQLFYQGLRKTYEMKNEASCLVQALRIELNEISRHVPDDLKESAIGIEHLLREFSQLYEASPMTYSSLPRIAASLLLYGIPLEIMNGDLSIVPVHWVKAVFLSLQSIKRNVKIFVLAVIGIQSSGKSTLLNTMFGLEFPVSAGRCTKGIFAQLLPAAQSSRDLPFDYILVLDTEGLRDPEHSMNMSHDNELATFVIGLADLTIVNMKGENTVEMRDTLQIAVHAFLRMKVVDTERKRRCIFLHQNVSAVNAPEKMKKSLQRMQSDLDQLTKEAAQAENITDDRLQKFSGVIEFKGAEDVRYLPDLLNGEPPMAIVNPSYSDKVREVKMMILQKIKTENPRLMNIKEFITKLEDMWTAILSDEFVYSFRNSLAIQANVVLESKFAQYKYELEQKVWMQIRLRESQLKRCTTIPELDREVDEANFQLKENVGDILEKILKCLDVFFDETDYKDILESFRQQKRDAMKSYASNEIAKAERRLLGQRDYHYRDVMLMERVEDQKPTFMKQAFALAKQLGKNANPEKIEEAFYNIWSEFVEPEPSRITTHMVRKRMESILLRDLNYEGRSIDFILLVVRSPYMASTNLLKGVSTADVSDELFRIIQPKGFVAGLKNLFYSRVDEEKEKVRREITANINASLREMNGFLEELCSRSEKHFYIHCEEFVRRCLHTFETWISNTKEGKYIVTPKLKAKFVSHAVNCAIMRYEKQFCETVQDNQTTADTVEIQRQMEKVLISSFEAFGQPNIIQSSLVYLHADDIELETQLYKSVKETDVRSTHVQFCKGYDHHNVDSCRSQIVHSLNDIMRILDNKLELICIDDSRFFKTHGSRFVKEILEAFAEFNQQKSKMFTFTWEARAYFAVMACHHAVLRFEAMNIRYDIKYGRRADLALFKDQSKTLFRNQVKLISQSETFAEIFCSVIKRQVEEIIVRETSQKIKKKVLYGFSHSKQDLIVEVMTDLANGENFKHFAEYIYDAYEYTSRWLKAKIQGKFLRIDKDVDDENDSSLYSTYALKCIDRLFEDICESIQSSSHAVGSSPGVTKKKILQWIKKFCKEITKQRSLTLSERDFQAVKDLDVSDINTLGKLLEEKVKHLQEQVQARFSNVDETSVVWDGNESPDIHIMQTLWGCKEQCPFCDEPCRHSIQNHEERHQCMQHRPKAVTGQCDSFRKPSMKICTVYIGSNQKYMCTSKKCSCRSKKDKQKEHMEEREHSHKDFKKYHPRWKVRYDPSGQSSSYWMWFMNHFSKELSVYYGYGDPNVPYSWGRYTKEMAIESLEKYSTGVQNK